MPVPYTFGTATSAIPLSQLDSNFATAITLGNTAVYLGNTTTSIGNLTLTNVTISSGEVTTGNASVSGNVTLTGGTANGVAYLNGSKVLTTGSALVFNGTNLGVGVTPSAWGSSFKVLQFANAASISSSDDPTFQITQNGFYNGTNWIYNTTAPVSNYYQSAGTHVWRTAASGTAGNAITFTQAMTLDASGAWLLGTTTLPSNRKFIIEGSGDTVGRINSGGASSGLSLEFANNGTLRGGIGNGAGNITSGSAADMAIQANANLVFASGGYGEKGRFDSSGNFLVGTTNANPNAGAGVKMVSDGTDGAIAVVGATSTNSNVTYRLYSTGAGAYRFYVGYGGTIFATSIVITAISDERLKENVRDIDTGLNSIMALKPRRFDWKEGKGQDKKNAAGFIAQEFEDVFPECVSKSMAGADGIEYKNINHETLIPTLVKAIQEQQVLIQTLTARITALESA